MITAEEEGTITIPIFSLTAQVRKELHANTRDISPTKETNAKPAKI